MPLLSLSETKKTMPTTEINLRVAKAEDLKNGKQLDEELIYFEKEKDGTFSGPKKIKNKPRTDMQIDLYNTEKYWYDVYVMQIADLLKVNRIFVVENNH